MSELIKVATIYTPFSQKFGIPRQGMMENDLISEIVLEPQFNDPKAIKGIEEYSHLWLIWGFSKNPWNGSLEVRPPRLGGNETRGVFATRSSYRPNELGLTSVKLVDITNDNNRLILRVTGADMLDGTPIYDIKPYLPYADIHEDAEGSFGQAHKDDRIEVIFPENELCKLPERYRKSAIELISMDPRAAYNKEPEYIYGLALADYDIRFTINNEVASIIEVVRRNTEDYSNIKS